MKASLDLVEGGEDWAPIDSFKHQPQVMSCLDCSIKLANRLAIFAGKLLIDYCLTEAGCIPILPARTLLYRIQLSVFLSQNNNGHSAAAKNFDTLKALRTPLTIYFLLFWLKYDLFRALDCRLLSGHSGRIVRNIADVFAQELWLDLVMRS